MRPLRVVEAQRNYPGSARTVEAFFRPLLSITRGLSLGTQRVAWLLRWIFTLACASVVFGSASTAPARSGADFVRQVRTIETDELGALQPVGLAFSRRADSFLVLSHVDRPGRSGTAVYDGTR